MIRINSLGMSKPKNRRSAGPSAPTIEVGDVGSPKVKVLVALMVAVAFNGFTWYHLDHQAQDIAANMKVAEQKNRELSEVKTKYLERQKEADNYKRRVDVIEQVRKNQEGPGEPVEHTRETRQTTQAGLRRHPS